MNHHTKDALAGESAVRESTAGVSRNDLETDRGEVGSAMPLAAKSYGSIGRILKNTVGKLVIVFAFMCLPLLAVVVKPAVTEAKLWWARRGATNAALASAGNDPAIAAASIINALRASPEDPKLLRTWAAFLKQHHGPAGERILTLKKVAASREAAPSDKAALACALVADGQFADGKKIIDALPDAERATEGVLEAQAVLRGEAGDHDGAMALHRAALGASSGGNENRFKLALLDLNESFEETRRQGFAALWELAHNTDETALNAADVLAAHGALSRSQSAELITLVERHPAATAKHTFLAKSGFLRTHPETRDAFIAAEVRKAHGYGPEDLVELALMLERAGAHRILLTVIPEPKALLNRELCVLRIKALCECGNFTALEELLSSRQEFPLTKGHMGVLRSFLHLQNGRTQEAMQALSLAQSHAIGDRDVETLQRVVGMAEAQGWWDIAVGCQVWIADNFNSLRASALDALFKAASNKRDAALMLATAERMAATQKDSVLAVSNLAYLRLLLGTHIESVPALLVRLEAAADEPITSGTRAFIEAFLCFRYGDKDAVRRLLARPTDWSRFPPGQRAVVATLQRFSGNDSLAHDLAARLPTLALLAKEQDLWVTSRE